MDEPIRFTFAGEALHDGKIGIIDIGSNSIRFVVYDGLKRAPLPLYNEKAFCALGQGLANTGKLNPHGMEMAEACMARFLAMARVMDVVELHILATAAVRDAKDGEDFVERLETKYNIHIRIISGKKEAKLGAYGIFSSIFAPDGICADMGGGSMELVALGEGRIRHQATLPLGALTLIDQSKGEADKLKKLIHKPLEGLSWLTPKKPPAHFYAIGGTFRAMAKYHMQRNNYPLKILHQYTLSASEALALTRELSVMSAVEVSKLPGIPAKRAAAILPGAMAMEAILKISGAENVVFSTSGIREGYLLESLSPYLRNEDPLIASCADLASQNGRVPGYARELFQWMQPLFGKETDGQKRLRYSACILTDIALRVHPEYRAYWAFYRVIQSSLIGLTHPQRVFLALATYHRYQFKPKHDFPLLTLIEEKEWLRAWLIGAATNLAFHLAGGMAGNLAKAPLAIEKGELKLKLAPELQDLLSDAVRKRLEGLGEVYKAFSNKD